MSSVPDWPERAVARRLAIERSTKVAPVWRRDHVFVTTPSSWPNEQGRSVALEEDWSLMLVQLTHTADAERNRRQVVEDGAGIRREGWAIGGWGTYGQGSEARADGLAAARLAGELGLDSWMANGETWAEGKDGRWKSVAFVDGWVAGGAPCPLGVSCNASTTANFARDFDYQSFLEIDGSVVAPQVYGNLNPDLTWTATLASLEKANVHPGVVAMTFGTYVDSRNPLDVPFGAYRSWRGLRGAYLGERTARDAWAKLRV